MPKCCIFEASGAKEVKIYSANENAAKCVASGPGWWPEAGNMIYLMLRILALYNIISISI